MLLVLGVAIMCLGKFLVFIFLHWGFVKVLLGVTVSIKPGTTLALNLSYICLSWATCLSFRNSRCTQQAAWLPSSQSSGSAPATLPVFALRCAGSNPAPSHMHSPSLLMPTLHPTVRVVDILWVLSKFQGLSSAYLPCHHLTCSSSSLSSWTHRIQLLLKVLDDQFYFLCHLWTTKIDKSMNK